VPRVTTIEIRIRILDNDSATRWNGGPLSSKEANEAMHKAVDAAQAAVRAEGFTILGTGYGATAVDYE
jgi:hypothetical protein